MPSFVRSEKTVPGNSSDNASDTDAVDKKGGEPEENILENELVQDPDVSPGALTFEEGGYFIPLDPFDMLIIAFYRCRRWFRPSSWRVQLYHAHVTSYLSYQVHSN